MLVAVLVLGHQVVLGMHHNRPAALQKHLPVVRMAYQILGRTGGVVHIQSNGAYKNLGLNPQSLKVLRHLLKIGTIVPMSEQHSFPSLALRTSSSFPQSSISITFTYLGLCESPNLAEVL